MSAQKWCGCGCGTSSCGCCAGVEPVTPEVIENRPGLAALNYRIGTYGTFFETMSARLGLHELPARTDFDGTLLPPSRPLSALSTRDPSDPTMALLDAWSSVGDVLTFYQERIANEGYLRTATETRSVYELARLVGYRPRPGVAASVYLAYSIDSNTPEQVTIPKGARAQSVPGPGEFPQSFETGAPLAARARWNDLKLRLEQPQRVEVIRKKRRIYFKGINTGLLPGDPLLIRDEGISEVVRVREVLPDNEKQRTLVYVMPWSRGETGVVLDAPGRTPVEEVIRRAPTNATARSIVERLRGVMLLADVMAPGNALPRHVLDSADAGIVDDFNRLTGAAAVAAAPVLQPWVADARAALRQAVRDEEDSVDLAAHAAANLSVESIVTRLSRPGSRPLANAAELPRSLAADFAPTSDAGLRFLGAVRPDIRDSLGPSIAGQKDPEFPQTLEVYAFRVRAGVFGRNFPLKQVTDTDTVPPRTVILGEWPIVEMDDNREDINATAIITVNAVHESARTLYLDTNYDGIVPGSWVFIDSSAVVVDKPPTDAHPLVTPAAPVTLTQVHEVHAKISRNDYGLSGDTVRLDIDAPWIKIPLVGDVLKDLKEVEQQADINRDFRVIRGTSVYTRSEKLELALDPIVKDFCGASEEEQPAELDDLYPDLEPGRFVIVTGERADLGEGSVVRAAEALMIRAVRHDVRVANKPVPWTDERDRTEGDIPKKLADDRPHTFVWFDKPLSYCYRRATVTIRANVVKATHGETRIESLGNGDGARQLQNFALKQFPLTYLSAPTATGADSTLEVYVNDVRWYERGSFVMSAATDRIYVTKADELGKTTVIFGNGIEGARLPTGSENVKSVYRNGIGKPGNVRAGQISQLSTRPLGVKDVVNPLRASGGADPESRDAARRNTPNAVMALDRLVSTRDYADFARAFAGIGKAASVELPDGANTVVHVTIAGADDIPVDPGSDLYRGLRGALRRLGDPFQPLALATRELLILVISARVRIAGDRRWEVVAAALRARLVEAFGFERRDLAQGVASSEMLAVMQSVPGVVYVDLDSFGAVSAMVADPQADGGVRARTPADIAEEVLKIVNAPSLPAYVAAEAARPSEGGSGILPAQLAILLPDAPDTLVLNRIE